MAPGFVKFDGDYEGCTATFSNSTDRAASSGAWDGNEGQLTSAGLRGSCAIRKELDSRLVNAKQKAGEPPTSRVKRFR